MRHFLSSLLLALFPLPSFLLPCQAQTSYLADNSIAVFQPKDYDASQHQPSLILQHDLVYKNDVPCRWTLRPVFSENDSLTIAEINVGDADLYGTGEVYGNLRRNGDRNEFWNTDNGAYARHDGKRLYQTHPWVLGVRKDGSAFGILADNTWRSNLLMPETTGADGTVQTTVRFESYGPAFRVVIVENSSPERVLRLLAYLTGTMELPPLWALGYQQCRFSYFPDSRVKEVADEFRQRHIPCDVIWMDIDYMQDFRIFTFNKERFPDPKGLNDYLHDRKFKSVYMIDPGVKVDDNYFVDQQGVRGDYFVRTASDSLFVGNVWPGPCHFPDFTRPDVRTWWSGLYKDFMAQGVDGVWNDMNEPAVFGGYEFTMPRDNQHLGGDGLTPGPHLRYHNAYGYNMVKASRAGILAANPTKRPFVLSRANLLGGQRYAATWTGDNASTVDHMKMSIPMTLNMGLTGQAFNGPDIGGFLDNCTPELLAQWTASGIYFPFTRNHSCDGTVDQEPWAMGPEVEAVCRTAIERRYRLLPYIYGLFRDASCDGLPVMRPVFMADATDLSLRHEQQAYMLGNDLLIVPRWAENPALPQGNWASVPFETKDDGYQADVRLRPGAVLPLAEVFESTVDYNLERLTLIINPDAEGHAWGMLYEDAGDGFEYLHGDFHETHFQADVPSAASSSLHRRGRGRASKGSPTVTLRFWLHRGQRPTGVREVRVGLLRDGRIDYSPWTPYAEELTFTF
ncbi:MAG: glycoside hydrolase family 31 protein [Bacteroidales bacterium]|nr:glycoside hydrolase family 31 protein [Bacteroidales bacterium]